MRWLKREMWKAGITIAGALLLLVLMVWVPVSVVGAQERVSALAGSGMVTVQATPTVDPTMTALEKEKLAQEIDQLKNQNYWSWTTIGPILVGFAGLLAALYSFITWIRNRRDEQKKRGEEQKRWLEDRQAERERRDEEQQRWLKDQEAEREKRDEDRFQTAITGLGSQDVQARIAAAVMLRTFLKPGYEQFYEQIFTLAVASLRLPPLLLGSSTDPDLPDPLSQELMLIFKESYPLARKQLEQQSVEKGHTTVDYKSLNVSGIQLNNALLSRADLSHAYMVKASLKKATLNEADLKETDLESANLNGAYLLSADLTGANLRFADLTEANFREADLSGADLNRATLKDSKLENAKSLKGTQMYDVKGLFAEQQEYCKSRGATFDPPPDISPPAFA